MKQYEVLQWAFSFLKKHEREEKVAEILLQHHLDVSKEQFFTMMQETVPPSLQEKFITDVKSHAIYGVPVQHLTGYEYFYGRKFSVNEHVLIPRVETEELVYHVIEQVHTHYNGLPLTIIDVGTGSGVIAITLALELPNATIYATDISKEALFVAEENAQSHHATVHFLNGNFLEPILEQQLSPQIIVSNPPYIRKTDEHLLTDTVKRYDPKLALFADNNGLAAYETIMKQIKKLPIETRNIYFEIGYDQATDVTSIIKASYPLSHIKTIKDINGKDRIISANVIK